MSGKPRKNPWTLTNSTVSSVQKWRRYRQTHIHTIFLYVYRWPFWPNIQMPCNSRNSWYTTQPTLNERLECLFGIMLRPFVIADRFIYQTPLLVIKWSFYADFSCQKSYYFKFNRLGYWLQKKKGIPSVKFPWSGLQ